MRIDRAPALFTACLLLGGCAGLDEEISRRQPDVSIESAHLGALSFEGAELVADVRIDNPNPVGATLAGFDYELAVAGQSLVAGERDQRLRLDAKEQAQLDVPLRVAFADVRNIVDDLLRNGDSRDQVDYDLALNLDIEVPVLGRRTVPAEISGSLPIPRVPSLSVTRLKLDSFGWRKAQATVEFAVDNPNPFGLDLERLNYDLAIDGVALLSGNEGVSASIPADSVGRVDVPIELDFDSLGRSAYRLVTGSGSFDYRLTGNVAGVGSDNRLGAFDIDFDHTGAAGIQR